MSQANHPIVVQTIDTPADGFLSRRGFLRRLAPLAGAMVVAPAALAIAPMPNPENLALLSLGEALDGAIAELRAATAGRRAAIAIAESTVPALPESLIMHRADAPIMRHYTEEPLNVDGSYRPLEPFTSANGKAYHRPPLRIYTADGLARYQQDCAIGRRSKIGKWLIQTKAAAEDYEARHEAAVIAAGLPEALDRHYFAMEGLRTAADNCRAVPALTQRGLAIKAAAITALIGEIDPASSDAFTARFVVVELGASLATDVLRIASEGGAHV